MYADDTTVTWTNSSLATLLRTLTADIATIATWLHHNHLLLNLSKTNAMDFRLASGRPKRDDVVLELKYEGKAIPFVKEVTLLGVIVDHKLTFDQHTIKICRKVNTKLFIYIFST